jgi:UDP-N-acetylglucosamine 3-dehydrogenase
MNFGMLGFAHVHAAGIAECVRQRADSELTAISDHDPDRLAGAVARFGGEGYADYCDLLANADVEAVIVMAETSRHRELIRAAAAAGKHVLCEKPIATTRSDGQAIVDACREHGVKLQTYFPMRFSRPVIELRRLVREGTIGGPLSVKATNPGQAGSGWFVDPVLAGGGAVMDHTVHVADLLRWIFDDEIVEVYAEIGTRLHPGLPVDDVGVLTLKLRSGLTASLDSSWSRPKTWPTWGGLTIEVIGERGVLAMDAFNEKVRLVEDRSPRSSFLSWGADANAAALQAFIDAVRHDTEPLVTGEDGLRALEVALCAYVSAGQKKPVVCPDCLVA